MNRTGVHAIIEDNLITIFCIVDVVFSERILAQNWELVKHRYIRMCVPFPSFDESLYQHLAEPEINYVSPTAFMVFVMGSCQVVKVFVGLESCLFKCFGTLSCG